jgi:hypothetical protein
MICSNCKIELPENTAVCPGCGTAVDHQSQVKVEIKKRRIQRYAFYAILVTAFLGMIGAILKTYSSNNKLLGDYLAIQNQLDESKKNLELKKNELESASSTIGTLKKTNQDSAAKLSDAEIKLLKQETDLKKVLEEKGQMDSSFSKCTIDLDSADANIYSLIIKLGKAISNKDLLKIPLADENLGSGGDADSDGLSDMLETAVGTDRLKADTDGDGYKDKDELLTGFDPNSKNKALPIDPKTAGKFKGSILLQVDSKGEAWYVAENSKRYFLGLPADAFRVMRDMNYWKNEWKRPDVSTSTKEKAPSVPSQAPQAKAMLSSSSPAAIAPSPTETMPIPPPEVMMVP